MSSDNTQSPYGYTPTLAATVIFTVAYSLTTSLHLLQAFRGKYWTMLVIVLGGITELIGWVSRLYSHHHVLDQDAFLSNTVTLIIAPTFFSAVNYIILGQIIRPVGKQYSYLSPKAYVVIFVTCDVISLVVQSARGAMASLGSDQVTVDKGTHIMVGGICFQMASMTFYVIFGLEFAWRAMKDRPYHKMSEVPTSPTSPASPANTNSENQGRYRGLIIAMFISTLTIYIRSVYRTVELLQGWGGYIITHEPYFDCLDGAMMVIAMAVFNIWHPMNYDLKSRIVESGNMVVEIPEVTPH